MDRCEFMGEMTGFEKYFSALWHVLSCILIHVKATGSNKLSSAFKVIRMHCAVFLPPPFEKILSRLFPVVSLRAQFLVRLCSPHACTWRDHSMFWGCFLKHCYMVNNFNDSIANKYLQLNLGETEVLIFGADSIVPQLSLCLLSAYNTPCPWNLLENLVQNVKSLTMFLHFLFWNLDNLNSKAIYSCLDLLLAGLL